jgi:hypothetical protein
MFLFTFLQVEESYHVPVGRRQARLSGAGHFFLSL